MKKKKQLKIVEKNEFQNGSANIDPAEYTKDVYSDNTELNFIMENENLTTAPTSTPNRILNENLDIEIVEENEFQTGGTNLDSAEYMKDVSSDNTDVQIIMENENLTTMPTSTPNRVLNENLNIDMKKYKYLNKFGCEL